MTRFSFDSHTSGYSRPRDIQWLSKLFIGYWIWLNLTLQFQHSHD